MTKAQKVAYKKGKSAARRFLLSSEEELNPYDITSLELAEYFDKGFSEVLENE